MVLHLNSKRLAIAYGETYGMRRNLRANFASKRPNEVVIPPLGLVHFTPPVISFET